VRKIFYALLVLSISSYVLGSQTSQAKNKIKLVYPPGAPSIATDYKSRMGVNFKLRQQDHQGIDIIGDNGQPIIAVAAGKVLEASIEKCWGPTIAIDHGKGIDGENLIALYGHLGEMFVSTGDVVKRGQLIGNLGNNHFEFRCIAQTRHLHFQLGRQFRHAQDRNGHWGHSFYLKDGSNGLNPHLYWADGKGLITCFEAGQTYPEGSITYPVPCDK
tara:strand:+ start:7382 stop:8029 length:648 start_codon:yes stop_codon:yes gene_type:complete